MKKKNVYSVNIDHDIFKQVVKNKQKNIYQLGNDEIKNLKAKDKIILIDTITNKKCKRKIKKISSCDNYSNKDNRFSIDDIKKLGIVEIEVKTKRHIIIKSILCVIALLLILYSYNFISIKRDRVRSNEIADKVNKIQKDKLNYVFIEINPSFVLTLKDGKVQDVACLNDDCMAIYNDIDVKGKDINSSISELYSLSKNKGYDTTKGIRVKTTSDVSIEKQDYITVEYISVEDKDELLNDLKNNEDIKNDSNDNYYATLWDSLKSDSDYGDVYTCNMDNQELKCNFTEKFISTVLVDYTYPGLERQFNKFINTFDKFKIEHKRINGIEYFFINSKMYIPLKEIIFNDDIVPPNILWKETLEYKKYDINNYTECMEFQRALTYEYIELKDFNLLNPNAAKVQTYMSQSTKDMCNMYE